MAKLAPSVVVIGTLGLVFLAGYWLLILPELHQIGDAARNVKKVESVVAVSTPQAKVPETPDQAVNDLLPATDNQYDLAVQIDALSKSLAVPLTSLSLNADSATGAPSGVANTRRVVVTISLMADYTHVQAFIDGLTSLGRYMQVNQVSLSSTTGSGGSTSLSGNLATQITAYAFFLPGS